jgi:cytochrome oxidase Cu insertion factor (SCO1/SenC/PrrC family)
MSATVAVFAVLGLLAQGKGKGFPEQGVGAEVDKPAPAFKLKTQDGKEEVELAGLKGKPAVLIFGSWT